MKNLNAYIFLFLIYFGIPSLYVSAQTPISFGQSITDSLPNTSSVTEFITPYAQPGDVLFIRVKPNAVQVRFELYSPSGNQLLDSIGSFNQLINEIYAIPLGGESGEYKIFISNIGIWTGDFCISLERMNEPPSAVHLSCGASLYDNHTCDSDIRSFRYLVEQGTVSRIIISQASQISGSFAPEVWICSPNGDILHYDEESYAQQLILDTSPASSTSCFYVFVTDATGSWTSDFNISHTIISGECASVIMESSLETDDVCEGGSFTLTAVSDFLDVSFLWTGPNNFTSTESQITLNNVTSAQSGTYIVSAFTSLVCTSTASISITVNPLPIAEASISPASGTLCSGEDISLDVIYDAIPAASFQWTGPNNFVSELKAPVIPESDTLNSGDYVIIITDGNGCNSIPDSVSVTVNPLPQAEIILPISDEFCEGENLILNVLTNIPEAIYFWEGPDNFTSNEESPSIPNIEEVNQGVYVVTVTDPDTECSHTDGIEVLVNPNPVANIFGDMEICFGESTTLTASGSDTYFWSNEETDDFILVNPVQSTTYSVTVTNSITGCSDFADTIVVVNELPSINLMSTPEIPEICSGNGDILLCMSSPDAQNPSYQWTSAAFNSNDQCVLFNSPSESGTYYGQIEDGITECINTDTIDIGIFITPTVEILEAPESPIYCAGTSFTLCSNSDATNPSYYWTGPNNFSDSILCITVDTPDQSQTGFYEVTVTSNDGPGCESSADLFVEIGAELECESTYKNDSLIVSSTGGFPPYTYTLLPGGDTNNSGVFNNLNPGNYIVEVNDSNDCDCTIEYSIITSTSYLQSNFDVTISPNPSTGIFIINIASLPLEEVNYTLFDMHGRLIDEFMGTSKYSEIDLSILPKGNYLLRAVQGNGTWSRILVRM